MTVGPGDGWGAPPCIPRLYGSVSLEMRRSCAAFQSGLRVKKGRAFARLRRRSTPIRCGRGYPSTRHGGASHAVARRARHLWRRRDGVLVWRRSRRPRRRKGLMPLRRTDGAVLDCRSCRAMPPSSRKRRSWPSGASITSLAAGNNFTCVLRSDGTVNCWGQNISEVASAIGTADSSSVPVVVVNIDTATEISRSAPITRASSSTTGRCNAGAQTTTTSSATRPAVSRRRQRPSSVSRNRQSTLLQAASSRARISRTTPRCVGATTATASSVMARSRSATPPSP